MKLQKTNFYRILSLVVLVVIALLFLFPLYWIVTGSVKEKGDILIKAGESVKWIPSTISWGNFGRLFSATEPLFKVKLPIPFTESIVTLTGPIVPRAVRWLYNSVFISLAAMFFTCLTASLAGYALAKKQFVGRAFFFSLIVCAMALPKQVILIPLLTVMKNLNLVESPWAVIFPVVGWPFGVFLMKQFSESIPTSLIEAARIDGAGEFRTFANVAFPIIKPGFGALAIFTFINAWNEYPLQLVMLHEPQAKTIALGIAGLQTEMSNDYGLIMAGAALAAVPIIVIFVMFQKYFTQGITMGAVKG